VRTFVDTSALYALLDADDDNHAAAANWFSESATAPAHDLVTHNYVLVESAALTHHRLGAAGVRDLFDALVPALTSVFVGAAVHERAVAAYIAGLSRRVSFVDRVSFQFMRDATLDRAFAFDRDFATEGFALVP
jgi:predicted nucleic acid-binding protein